MDNSLRVILSLQKTLGQMEIALGAIREAIVWTNRDGVIQWCNAAFDNLVSMPHIMVLGKKIYEIFSPKKNGTTLEIGDHPFNLLKNAGSIDKHIYEYDKDDATLSLEISANNIVMEDGDDIYIFFIQDISKLKTSEELLRRANENLEVRIRERASQLIEISNRYAAILDCAVDSIISIDPKGKMLSLNPAAEKMFGYSSSEIVGKNVNMLMPEPFHSEHDGYLKKYLETNKSKIIGVGREVTGRKKNGDLFPLYLAVSEVRFSGQLIFTGILRDISEQKAIMADLEKAKIQAEEANKSKSDFLARISHELRTPLNAIIGMSDLLLEEEALNDEQRKYVRVSRSAGEHLLNIIEDLLDVARIEAGKMFLDNIRFNLGELVDDVTAIVRLTAQKKELEVSCIIEGDVPRQLKGDPKRLRQILINLMGNSIKFTEKGAITLIVSLKEYDKKKGELTLLFSISDTGIGISKEVQKSIFESFSQGHAVITRKYGGTGLGLSICQTLVEMMHGEISVESIIGEGSTFFFTAKFQHPSPTQRKMLAPRIRTAPGKTDAKNSTIDKSGPPLRILLAEDSADNRLLFTTYLKKLNCTIDMAENGQIAVDKFLSGKYDIILLDIQMPIMDGYTAARTIRHHEIEHKLKPIPIIALTAHALDADRQASLDAGCTQHVVKPVPKKVLIEAINSLTHNE